MTTPTLPDLDPGLGLGEDALCTLQFVVGRQPFCTRPAEWACRLACCGHLKVVCDHHRRIVSSVKPRVFVCHRCGTIQPGVSAAWRI